MLESWCEGRKRGGKKRLHFFILVFCFCVLLTKNSNQYATVYATEDEKESMSGNSVSDNSIEEETEPTPQSQGEAMWQAQAGGEWLRGSLVEAVAGVYSGGTVVLLSDILLTDEITVSKSVLITSNDTDSPCTIKNISQDTDDRVSRGRIFTVNGGPVTLENIILDGGRNEGFGVQLGLSRWVRPDEGEHPYREMIVPYKGYTIQQEDLDKLNIDGKLYADNMEKYAFIPYEERVVMVLAVNVVLDKNKLSFDGAGETDSLIATVLPVNALIKDVFWLSSDPDVATVDANGIVTAVGEGEAVITVTTVSPYNATASCKVTVGKEIGPEEGEAGPDDPIPDKDPDGPKDTGSGIVWVYVVLGFSVFLMLASTAAVFSYHKNARENEREVREIIREVVREPAKTYEGEKEDPTVEWMDGIQIDFERLEELNDDTAGWIIFHNQRVNYPLVRTDDNSYYLNHSFMREENKAGSIFMDCRNNSLEDRHVVIYGHNMLDRTMFGSLKDVFHKKFWEKGNDLIYLFDTDQHLRKYKIFSYYTIEKEDYYITTLFRNDAVYAEFLEVLQARSFGETDVSVTSDDHILTLSTCAGASGTRRRVIHAKLLQEKMD